MYVIPWPSAQDQVSLSCFAAQHFPFDTSKPPHLCGPADRVCRWPVPKPSTVQKVGRAGHPTPPHSLARVPRCSARRPTRRPPTPRRQRAGAASDCGCRPPSALRAAHAPPAQPSPVSSPGRAGCGAASTISAGAGRGESGAEFCRSGSCGFSTAALDSARRAAAPRR